MAGVAASHPYAGRKAALATMHGKEAAIAPALRRRPGLIVTPAPGIDTDRLGTFAGDVPRPGSIEQTAIAKARLGMAAAGLPIGLASEGSFGPNPAAPILAMGVEMLILVDDERDRIIRETWIDPSPVFGHVLVADPIAAAPFLERIGFPDHGVILRPNQSDPASPPSWRKDIATLADLQAAIGQCTRASPDGLAFLATDMRAHRNPTRMAALGRLAERLADRLAAFCPACDAFGYGEIARGKGLPCAWCGGPTTFPGDPVLGCTLCGHREMGGQDERPRQADPRYCPQCNP